MPFDSEDGPGGTDSLNVTQPEASMPTKSFYGPRKISALSRKVPFYLRYSQSCKKQSLNLKSDEEEDSDPEQAPETTNSEATNPESEDTVSLNDSQSEASMSTNSFYGSRKTTPFSRKVPFYLRYSQSCKKKSLNLKSDEEDDMSDPEQDSETTNPKTTNSEATNPKSEDRENECPKSAPAKRPCYYQEPREQRKYIASLKPVSSRSTKTFENLGIPSPQAQSPKSPLMTMSAKTVDERKFFKNRRPSVNDRCSGTAVIKQGFNLSFVPRRLSSSFDKKAKRQTKHPGMPRKRRRYSKKIEVEEMPLPPLSNVFPELDLDSASSVTSVTSATEFTAITQRMEDPVVLLTPAKTNDDTSNSTCGSVSSPGVSTMSDSESVSKQSPKVFSVFSNRQRRPGQSCLVPPSECNILIPRFIKDSEDHRQMTLDAGQKKFGAIQCPQCGMVYTQADPLDETTHAKFHHSVLATLKFPGWKKERVVQEYLELGSRVILVMPDDQKYKLRKVNEINQMMGQELGFPDATLSFCRNYKVFLYISEEKRVDGCCIAESITKGYRVIPNRSVAMDSAGRRPWCCQTEPEQAVIGISKIWVYSPSRRNNVASKLLDCVRSWFEYGVPVERNMLAFSDPTPDGMQMAAKYTGTPAFLVYKCRMILHQD